MNRQQMFFGGWGALMGALLLMGCMDRAPAAICPVPTELKSSDPGLGGFQGVDILVVVDNSSSMREEQAMLATAFFPLVNTLIDPTETSDFAPSDDVRIAITTTDMGVSYGGHPYTDDFSPQAACVDPLKNGLGDNGAFISGYRTPEVDILENVIPCDADGSQCPTDWTCDVPDGARVGRCVDPDGDGTGQECPLSPEEQNMSFIPEGYDPKLTAFTVACLADVGIDGCGFEQQLAAGAAGLRFDDNFVRKNSLTAVMIVSDEEDCSIESDEWHDLKELKTTETNVACGRHQDLLTSVKKIRDQYNEIKIKKAGNANGMLFAAIVGVPPVAACQGRGNTLGDCLDVSLAEGTVGDPATVERENSTNQVQTYYEFACERKDADGTAITQAYAGTRYVELAQLYGDMSYVYSICNENWSEAMVDVAEMIAENLNGTCYGKRLSWNPKTETADCNVVYEYLTLKSESRSAPACPDLAEKYDNDEFKWVGDGEVTTRMVETENGSEPAWVRSCTVQKIPAPLNCNEFEDMAEVENTRFGWYYCENPGENNREACNDDLDNDRDGKVDEKDEDCASCISGNGGVCKADCPYKVSISDMALAEAQDAYSANVVCLQQYRFEDPNCKEGTFIVCNDGIDNDGNGPFDCHSYSRADADSGAIPDDHFPDAGARNADPDCCPMQRDGETGACEFLDARGIPVSPEDASWVSICNAAEVTPDQMPDACCEASAALLCVLPKGYRESCQTR
ncbi:MAG: hypothetical protein JXX14_11945 [Deltaproteobacteria bacterium]|nr:hypothetical protein [Deltaproteobacteria bacterium]